jgi:HlyD family secretion protein
MDGTIIQKNVETGQIIASASANVSGGTTLLLMADLSEMQVRTLVDETDIGRIAPGLPARVSVEAYTGRAFEGTVMKIEPQAVVEQNVTMFPVLVHLANPEGLLKPGMNAEVEVEIATRRDVVTVPNAAVVAMRDGMAAAGVLGLDEEAFRAAMRGGANGNGGGNAGAAGDAARGARGGGTAGAAGEAARGARGGAAGTAGAAGPAGAVEAGGGAQAPPAAANSNNGGSQAAATPALPDAAWSGQGGRGARGARATTGDGRPGFVFVTTPEGPQPRRVILGLNDWDSTEIISGLEPGEQVYLISVARLQQQQQQLQERFRQRAGGGVFPGSAAPAGGRGAR